MIPATIVASKYKPMMLPSRIVKLLIVISEVKLRDGTYELIVVAGKEFRECYVHMKAEENEILGAIN
jgi:hypothetical protein